MNLNPMHRAMNVLGVGILLLVVCSLVGVGFTLAGLTGVIPMSDANALSVGCARVGTGLFFLSAACALVVGWFKS